MSMRTSIGLLTALTVFLSGGCAVGPDFKRPDAPVADKVSLEQQPSATITAEGEAQHFNIESTVPADWWHQFGSPQLDEVVTQALAGNPGLQAAQASLRRSQADLRAGYGVFYPQIDVGADAARQKNSPQRLGENLPASIFNLFTLSASVSYALDVFGGERRAVEGLQAQEDLQRYQLQAAYLSLSANIVNTLIARSAYVEQIETSEQIVSALREQARIAAVQAQAGTAPYADVLSLDSALASFEAALPSLRQKVDAADDLLATLVGKTPAEWRSPTLHLSDLRLPVDVPAGLPSRLVAQRPDILESEATLHGASANIGVATAAMLPSITLTGGYGVNSIQSGQLFSASSGFWSAAAGVTTPVFEGGTLWFHRRSAIEQYHQAEADYRQTVLAAFAQVADTLRALQHDAEALEAQSRQLDATKQAWQLVKANYTAGTVNYLAVLVAELQYRQAVIAYVQDKALRLQDTVALFAALGGGWDAAAVKSGQAGG
jgi:NodT family efflux transporter outer membrane factor (OMF) lipoprotein